MEVVIEVEEIIFHVMLIATGIGGITIHVVIVVIGTEGMTILVMDIMIAIDEIIMDEITVVTEIEEVITPVLEIVIEIVETIMIIQTGIEAPTGIQTVGAPTIDLLAIEMKIDTIVENHTMMNLVVLGTTDITVIPVVEVKTMTMITGVMNVCVMIDHVS